MEMGFSKIYFHFNINLWEGFTSLISFNVILFVITIQILTIA